MSSKHSFVNLGLLITISAAIFWTRIDWGLPSTFTNRLYFQSLSALQSRVERIKRYGGEVRPKVPQTAVPRSWYNPIRSYHPDEYFVIKSLAGMNPKRCDFNPRQFSIGGAYLYPLGALLLGLSKLNLITLTSDLGFYFLHPEEIARFYLTGRFVSAFFGIGVVILTYLLTLRIWGEKSAGLIAGLLVSFSPLLVLNTHYMYVDIPGLFWIMLTLYLGVRFLQEKRPKFAPFLLGVTSGLAAGSKLPFLPVFLIPLTTIVFSPGYFLPKIRQFLWATGGFFTIFFLFNPYLFQIIKEMVPQISRSCTLTFLPLFYLQSLRFGLGLPLLSFSLIGFILSLFFRGMEGVFPRERLLVLIWTFLFFFFISSFAVHFGRYILPIVPSFIALGVGPWVVPSKRKRGITIFKKLVASFVVVATFLYGMAYLSLFWKENTRTVAGKWIKESLLPGATIGVTEVPWQFQLPPLDEDRYCLVVTGYNLEKLKKAKPDYFLLSSFQAGISPVPAQLSPEKATFWKEFEDSGLYQPLASFSQPLQFLGFKFSQNFASEDFIYLNPTIVIFETR